MNYQQLLKKIESLKMQASKLEASGLAVKKKNIQRVFSLMTKLNITMEDLGGTGASAQKPSKGAKTVRVRATDAKKAKRGSLKGSSVQPKYKHPESGKLWTGRGLMPKWVQALKAEGKLDSALIVQAATNTVDPTKQEAH
jgi:DNA-binding protein H-NS